MNEVVLHTLANWASPEGKDRSVLICHGRVGMRASCPICFFERSCESVFSSNILEFWDVTALPEHSVGHCIEGPVWPRIPIFWSLNQYLICRFPEYVPWGESFGPGGRWKTFLALIVALPLVSWMPLGRGTSVDLTSLVVKYESKLGNLRFPLIYSLIFLCMYFFPWPFMTQGHWKFWQSERSTVRGDGVFPKCSFLWAAEGSCLFSWTPGILTVSGQYLAYVHVLIGDMFLCFVSK